MAIGCVNGAVLIYRFLKERPRANVFASLVFYKVVQDCVEAVDDLKYSPDGKMLAVGSHDNFVGNLGIVLMKLGNKEGRSTIVKVLSSPPHSLPSTHPWIKKFAAALE